jgi:hypothetical protein
LALEQVDILLRSEGGFGGCAVPGILKTLANRLDGEPPSSLAQKEASAI